MPDSAPDTASQLGIVLAMATLSPGGMGGSETYARELAGELATRAEITVDTIVPEDVAGVFPSRRESVISKLRVGASNASRLTAVARVLAARSPLRGPLADAELVHYPFTVPAPRAAPGQRTVVTLHDVQHLEMPELFSRLELEYRRIAYDRAARRAHAVVTVSAFAKSTIVERLGISPDRVHVAHLGVRASDFVPQLEARDDFVLYPARGWPHKNHHLLVRAMEQVRAVRPGMRLILTGGALERLGPLPEWVEAKGLVPLEELRELYRRAAVMAFPSLYEGFGLPPLEAMASGCPVAASDSGSLAEVCGDAAVMFNPRDANDIARGIIEAAGARPELVRAGLDRAAAFSWAACADAHVAAYRAALA